MVQWKDLFFEHGWNYVLGLIMDDKIAFTETIPVY